MENNQVVDLIMRLATKYDIRIIFTREFKMPWSIHLNDEIYRGTDFRELCGFIDRLNKDKEEL